MNKGAHMKMNEGNVDRFFRVAVGLGILSMTIMGPQTLWGLIGLVPLITGLVGFCPLYSVLGINTCSLHGKTSQ
jgi:hypothetical protein